MSARRCGWNPASRLGLKRHLRAAQAPSTRCDALGAARIEEAIAFFMRAERDRCSSCLHVLGDQLRIQVGALDLSMLSCTCFLVICFISSDSLSTCSPFADHEAGRAVRCDRDLVALALDRDLRDAGL